MKQKPYFPVFSSLFLVMASAAHATTVYLEPLKDTPYYGGAGGGPVISKPVGYNVGGIGQSVTVTPELHGAALESFEFTASFTGSEKLYVFDREYQGLSSDLASLSPGEDNGLLGSGARASGDDGLYQFDNSGIILTTGQQLFFYTDQISIFVVEASVDFSSNWYPEGEVYFSQEEGDESSFGDAYSVTSNGAIYADIAFRLGGSFVSGQPQLVPEPNSVMMLVLASSVLLRRRNRC